MTQIYKTFLREIKENLIKWRDICSRIGRFDIVKIAIILMLNYRFSAVPLKIPVGFLFLQKPTDLKYTWICKKTQNSQINFGKRNNNNKVGRLTLPDLKTTVKVAAMKTVCCWHKQTYSLWEENRESRKKD